MPTQFDVLKPSAVPIASDTGKPKETAHELRVSEPDVLGTIGGSGKVTCQLAHEAGVRIVAELGTALGRGERMKALAVFRRTLFPARKPGRKQKEVITAAHRDWKNGMRGTLLYRTHIPGWDRHNSWRRTAEARALLDAVHARDRPERKRAGHGASVVEP